MAFSLDGSGDRPSAMQTKTNETSQSGNVNSQLRAPSPNNTSSSSNGRNVNSPTPSAGPIAGLEQLILQVPRYHVSMDETQFMDSLSRFLLLARLTLKKVPEFQGRPVQMHRMLQVVCRMGGFTAVSQQNKWSMVAEQMSFQVPSVNGQHVLLQLRSLYYTLFYAYEQYFVQRIPIDRVIWPVRPVANTASSSVKASATTSTAKEKFKTQLPQNSSKSQPLIAQVLLGDALFRRSIISSVTLDYSLSLDELSLMLVCPFEDQQAYALGHLERLTSLLVLDATGNEDAPISKWDPAYFANSLSNLLDALQVVLMENVSLSASGSVAKKCTPSKWFEKKENQRLVQLRSIGSDERFRMEKVQSVAVILSHLSQRSEFVGVLVQQHQLAILVVDLVSVHFDQLDLDAWKDLLTFVLQLSTLWDVGSMVSQWKRRFLVLMQMALAEIDYCLDRHQRPRLAHLLISAYMPCNDVDDAASSQTPKNSEAEEDGAAGFGLVEQVKKGIIQFINASNVFWKAMPDHVFMLVELVGRIASNVSVVNVMADVETARLSNDALADIFADAARTLARLFQMYAPIAMIVGQKISQLRGIAEFVDSEEHRKWISMVLHNPGFGLPDGGFLEISLISMQAVMRRIDISPSTFGVGDDLREMVGVGIRVMDALRRFWAQRLPSNFIMPGTQWRSPLLTIPLNSLTSHPFAVYCRLMEVISQLVVDLKIELSMEQQQLVVLWMSAADVSMHAVHLVNGGRLVDLMARLLN